MQKINNKKESFNIMIKELLGQNNLIMGLFGIYFGLAILFFIYNGLYDHASFLIYKLPYFIVFALIILIKSVAYLLSNRLHYGQYIGSDGVLAPLKKSWLNHNIIIVVFVPLLLISLMMSVFGSVKTLFPMVNPFYLDFDIMKLDKVLHFGFHPWELTHALFGSVFMTQIIDFLYQLWFLLFMVFTVWMVASYKLGHVRAKFIVSFILTWALLGTLLAAFLSAAGPCFYGNFVTEPNVYGPLMARLNEISDIIKGENGELGLYAIQNQFYLWSFYTDEHIGLGSGITAMPSMHVSFAMLIFLTVREMNRKFGYAAFVYLVLIQIGSVHLGWHYALDGYVSIILTWGVWRFSGWLVALVSRPAISREGQLVPENAS